MADDLIPVNTREELLGLIRLYGYQLEDDRYDAARSTMRSIEAALANWKPAQQSYCRDHGCRGDEHIDGCTK